MFNRWKSKSKQHSRHKSESNSSSRKSSRVKDSSLSINTLSSDIERHTPSAQNKKLALRSRSSDQVLQRESDKATDSNQTLDKLESSQTLCLSMNSLKSPPLVRKHAWQSKSKSASAFSASSVSMHIIVEERATV